MGRYASAMGRSAMGRSGKMQEPQEKEATCDGPGGENQEDLEYSDGAALGEGNEASSSDMPSVLGSALHVIYKMELPQYEVRWLAKAAMDRILVRRTSMAQEGMGMAMITYEDSLWAVCEVEELEGKPDVTMAKEFLRRYGADGKKLASRLGKLSKYRNAQAHPGDTALAKAIRGLVGKNKEERQHKDGEEPPGRAAEVVKEAPCEGQEAAEVATSEGSEPEPEGNGGADNAKLQAMHAATEAKLEAAMADVAATEKKLNEAEARFLAEVEDVKCIAAQELGEFKKMHEADMELVKKMMDKEKEMRMEAEEACERAQEMCRASAQELKEVKDTHEQQDEMALMSLKVFKDLASKEAQARKQAEEAREKMSEMCYNKSMEIEQLRKRHGRGKG